MQIEVDLTIFNYLLFIIVLLILKIYKTSIC